MHSFTAMNPATWTCTRADDRHLLHMPIFHIGGAFIASMALCVGASIAVVERFRTEAFWPDGRRMQVRSEEHTSELQSLMRISYAVLCLKTTNERGQQNDAAQLNVKSKRQKEN